MKIKISVKNLWKKYGNNSVLRGLDLDVYEGETVVILGRSGVGKSVLLKQIMGLEKPDSGSIQVNGFSIGSLKQSDLYKAISNMGMLFQGGALFDSMTIEENTSFYLNGHNGPKRDKKLINRTVQMFKCLKLQMKI